MKFSRVLLLSASAAIVVAKPLSKRANCIDAPGSHAFVDDANHAVDILGGSCKQTSPVGECTTLSQYRSAWVGICASPGADPNCEQVKAALREVINHCRDGANSVAGATGIPGSSGGYLLVAHIG